MATLNRIITWSSGRPFVKRLALCYGTIVLSDCNVGYCGQTVGWTKMPLDTVYGVGLGQGDTVLDGDPVPPTERDTAAPSHFFRPMSIVAKRLLDQDTTWYRGRLWPR